MSSSGLCQAGNVDEGQSTSHLLLKTFTYNIMLLKKQGVGT